MANIRIKDLPADGAPKPNDIIPIDLTGTRGATVKNVVESGRPTASKTEAELGVEPQKAMTPLTTKQAIDSQVGSTYVPKTVKVNAGAGMTGGGALSGDVTVGLTANNVDRLNKVDGIETGAQVNTVTSVAGKTGAVTLDAEDVGAVPDTSIDDIAANTLARHTHSNKAILDATTASFLTAEKTKLAGIEAGAQVNTVTSVSGKTGAVTLAKADVGLGNVDNTSDVNKPISTATQNALDGKYDNPAGTTEQYIRGDGSISAFPDIPQGTVTSVGLTVPPGLSASGSPVTSSGTIAVSYATGYQGYTSAEASKLSGIAAGATANQTDAYLLSRANHTGAQAISTVTGLQAGLDAKANAAIIITAGTGLTGGGTLAANRTIALSSTSIASLALADTSVQPARTIAVGAGLTGGGTLAANRTIALNAASIASLAKADTAVQPSSLATVATSGAYNDLTGRPTLGNMAAKNNVAISDIAATGTPNLGSFLRGDGTWSPVAGAGTVTSVAMTVPTGLSIAGSPITGAGTLAVSYASGYQGYTTAEANKLSGIAAGAQVNTVTSVSGKTGAVALAKSDVGLGSVDNTSDANKPVSTAQQTALNLKLDKTAQAADSAKLDGKTPAELPISTATQAALNGKANLTGAEFTGDVAAVGADLLFRKVRNNSGAGTVNDGPFIRSMVGNESQAIQSTMWCKETVGSRVDTVIASEGGGSASFMEFSNAGNLSISGRVNAGSKSFVIDHPLDPSNKNLLHTSIETARNEVQYSGTAQLNNGEAIVTIDDDYHLMSGTIAALSKDGAVTSLVNQSGFSPLRFEMIEQGKFKIICQDESSNDRVVWSYAAIRNDPFTLYVDSQTDRFTGNFIAEQDKAE